MFSCLTLFLGFVPVFFYFFVVVAVFVFTIRENFEIARQRMCEYTRKLSSREYFKLHVTVLCIYYA